MARFDGMVLVRADQFGARFNDATNAKYVELRAPSSIAGASPVIFLPSLLPASKQMMTIDQFGAINFEGIPGGGGGGTVTQFTAPQSFFSVTNGTTTPQLRVTDQNSGTFLAGPAGSNGPPTFRFLFFSDVAGFVGTGANSFAAGNDSRFHTANTDIGTNQTSFVIDSGNTGPRLKNTSGAIAIRNNADTANANLICGDIQAVNLLVSGTTTTINSEELTVNDNIIVLNNNVTTGTPTEDGGVQVRRGSAASAQSLWNETLDRWEVGSVGDMSPITRFKMRTFTSTDLVSNVLTWGHNFGNQWPNIWLVDNNNQRMGEPRTITYTDANTCSIDLGGFASLISTTTWRVCGNG